MKKYVVITTIFKPTESVKKFAELEDYTLVIAGDKKTPIDWLNSHSIFLSVDEQEKMRFKLTKSLPYNHYSRKMTGYLYAIKNGADLIIDTDDDNIPKEKWLFPDFIGDYDNIPGKKGFINIYHYFTDASIWPRGFPLRLLKKKEDIKNVIKKKSKVGIWQGLADEDPDVDAIYRLTSDSPCVFNSRSPIVLQQGTVSPFNSQNTAFIKELFPLLYLPTFVTFRFTDILRGIVAQPIMWAAGYSLGFIDANVVQKRNPHDYYKDFISEIPMYLYIEKTLEIVESVVKSGASLENNLANAYEALQKEDIVTENELKTLELWLSDLSSINPTTIHSI